MRSILFDFKCRFLNVGVLLLLAMVMATCGIDKPEEKQSSFETMTVEKTDIEVPIKFSAKMKGQSDVTISPQVSGQLMKICVIEGQQVSRGQVLFVIDSRNAQHDLQSAQANHQAALASLQSAQANLQSAQAQANSAKLEYESNKNLYDKKIVSNYTLENSLNTYRQAQAADNAMEEAFYNMQVARSAFYPGISLSGTAGWTNSAGGAVINPGKILLSIVGSLTQPIFARGQLKGNLKIAQLTQQDMRNRYVQTVIDAGNQVNEALADCQAASEKHGYYHRQVEVLHDAYDGTHELMDNGKASYLEVLTAQESLLSAQLSEATNMYDAAQAIIALYIALGGATR